MTEIRICQAPDCNNPRDIKQRSSLCIMHRVRRSRFKSFCIPGKEDLPEDLANSYKPYKNPTKSTGKICSISNCIGRVYHHGTICSMHRWRKKKFDSYDLPTYIGEPNMPVIPILPDGIVMICEIHGELEEIEAYARFHKGKLSSYTCKECTIDKNLKNTFQGMLRKEYNEILIKQNSVCAICFNPEKSIRNGIVKKLSVDHSHITDKIRGLLCQACNVGLGFFKDNIELLQSAIDYLEKHS